MATRPRLSQRVTWRSLSVVFTGTVRPLARVSATGQEHLPRREPYLLLANHVSFLDPFAAAYFARRRVHFMASAHWFDIPRLDTLLDLVGAFPKMKFTRDPRAMELLNDWYRAGEVVSIFPEGRRSWDGHTVPIRPRIGRVIRRLDCTVVFCRILTGHYHQPRWATYPRWAPFRMAYSEPVRFPAHMDEAEIDAAVQEGISVDPDQVPAPRLAWGWRLAWGLPNYLWACPRCFAVEGLRVDRAHRPGDRVSCRRCGATWRVDVASRLHPVTPGLEGTTVARAARALWRHFGDPPRAAPPDAPPGVVLRDPGAVWAVDRGGARRPVGTGVLELTESHLRLREGGSTRWQVVLADLGAVSVEANTVLQVRPPGALVRLDVGEASVVKWQSFILKYRARVRGAGGRS